MMSVRVQVNYSVQFFPAWFMMCVSILHLRRKHPSCFTPLHLLYNTLFFRKTQTLEEIHLFLASHFLLEKEKEELAQVKTPCCLPKFLSTGVLCVRSSLWAKPIRQLGSQTQPYRRSTSKQTGPSGGHSHHNLPDVCDTHKSVPDFQCPYPSQGIRLAVPSREVNLSDLMSR